MVNMAAMIEKKILEAREHLREAEKWYKICFISRSYVLSLLMCKWLE